MSEITLKRKKRSKGAQLLSLITDFISAHVKEDEGERAVSLRRRYLFSCARIISGVAFSALISRSQLAFSVYPFGIMFICASQRATPLYALASIISYLTIGGVSKVYGALCALILLARTLLCMYTDTKAEGRYKIPAYNEWVAYRVIYSCAASFIIGLYNLIYFSFSYYSLLGSILCMLACPVGTYIFSAANDTEASQEARDTARLFLCAVFVWSLSGISPFGINAGKIAAFCLIASEADAKHCGPSAIMGLVCGLPFGISSCAVYAIAAALCAGMKSLSSPLANIGAYTFILMAEGYIGGYSALLSSLAPTSVGVCSVLLWQKYDIRHRLCSFSLSSLTKKREAQTQAQTEPSATGIGELSRAFSSLSSTLKALSVHSQRSVLLDTNGICTQAMEQICSDCPARERCQGEEDIDSCIKKLASAVSHDGRLSEKTLPPYILQSCRRKQALISEINRRTARATEQCFSRSGAERLCSDYAAMAKILDVHLSKKTDRDRYDREASEALAALCRRKMYGIGEISVFGSRYRRILAKDIDLASHTVSAAELQSEFEAVCGGRLTYPVYTIDGTDIAFEIHTAPKFKANAAIAALPKENEDKSGDSARTFSNNEGYFYGILCDGMGSGDEAAYTSGICAEYLTCMLSCSNPKEMTLEMLNSVLREERGENSSTVDIFELDTYTGDGCFLKSGAAPSYVCRGKNVYRISAKTIPIGITEKIGAEKIRFKLRRGDVVVMLSDGIVDDDSDSRLVVETLCRRTTQDPCDVATAILCAAKAKHDRRDDMTVVCVEVK